MSEDLVKLEDLNDPIAVVAFSGWSDAGEAATDAVAHIMKSYPHTFLSRVMPSEYYDFQANRPRLGFDAEGNRSITWATTEVHVVHHPVRDLVVVMGPEPSFRWPEFAAEIAATFTLAKPEFVVFLGAMLTDSPHSRPVPVSITADTESLRSRFGAAVQTYEGPTGMTGILGMTCQAIGIPTASLWASTPHYVASPPNPKAMLALLTRLEEIVGGDLHMRGLDAAADEWEAQVDRLAADDPDIAEYIDDLEKTHDERQQPSGDVLAAEFQRYLRQNG